MLAPTGIPGSGAPYVQRGPLASLAMLVGPSAIVRDVFGEDASTTHTGSAPQAHAGFRNLALIAFTPRLPAAPQQGTIAGHALVIGGGPHD